MTVRRLNYTGRQKIRHGDVQITLLADGDQAFFDAKPDLEEYAFPAEATVGVEAYVGWLVMRFDFGTIAAFQSPPSTALSEFWSTEGLLFRLKVIGSGAAAGQLLGTADRLHATDLTQPSSARSFIAVRPVDLGQVVWQLSFDASQPVLQLNNRLADWRTFIRRPAVRSMLIPEVVRQVLLKALDDRPDDDDIDSWQSHALRMVSGVSDPPDTGASDDEVDDWVDEAVRTFARRHHLWRGVSEFLDSAEE